MSYAGATREQYTSALDGLWSDLTGALTRLERIAAEPEELDDDALDVLPVLQYSLHRAGEAIHGLAPLPASADAHHELAAALEDARDVTGDVACLLEAGEDDAALDLVHEWRGALFRVRLARRRLTRMPQAPPVEADEPRSTLAAAAALGLLATGTAAFLAGAVLVTWPLWAAGLGLVAISLLVFRP
ncbi:MAG TPA: hypothetical protein VFR32_01865 [Gaiellaceae bacterium]|nr:hypothetical protein [Gaiellaceae bacterium]